MTIDWANFTPWFSLAGGTLIGLAATLFILLNGRIAGISGVVGGLLRPAKGDVLWRVSFIAGLVIAPVLFQAAFEQPDIQIDASTLTLIAAGLLVGSARGMALVVRAGMAYVDCRAGRRARWSRRPHSWPAAF